MELFNFFCCLLLDAGALHGGVLLGYNGIQSGMSYCSVWLFAPDIDVACCRYWPYVDGVE